jgi:4-hydroxyphenylpyruvate dioxygenase
MFMRSYGVDGGRVPGGDEAVRESLKRFLEMYPGEKVSYIQLSSGKLFDPPMKADDVLFEGLEIKDPRLAWSRGARPFPLGGGLLSDYGNCEGLA